MTLGRLIRVDRLTPELCRAHPDSVFLFGDNMVRQGKAGQAVIRDEPNAVGVPTKWTPRMSEQAFFTNKDCHNEAVQKAIEGAFAKAIYALNKGHDVYVSKNGIGTGLAQLPKRAPAIAKYIDDLLKYLANPHPLVTEDGEIVE